MKWLRKIFGLCEHHYEIISEFEKISRKTNLNVGMVYVQKCKLCGKMHNHVLNVEELE